MRLQVRRGKWVVLLTAISAMAAPALAVPPTSGTGPGGIGLTNVASPLQLWLQGDTNVGANGLAVSNWVDSSFFGRTGVATGAGTPATLQNSVQNGHNVVRMAVGGSQYYNLPYAYTTGTVFAVSRYTHSGVGTTFEDFDGLYATNTTPGNTWFTGANGTANWYVDGASAFVGEAGDGMFNNGKSTSAITGLTTNFNIASGVDISPDAFGGWIVGQDRLLAPRLWQGDIAEVAVYSTALNSAQRIIIENSLSAKYNVAIDTTGGVGVAGTEVYAGDTGGNGDYDRDVFGVGRVSSTSISTAAGAAGMGIEVTSGLGDGEFVLAGHKVGTNSFTTNGLASAGNIHLRSDRAFYVDATGSLAADFVFDLGDLGLGAPAYGFEYELLYSANPNTLSFISLGQGTLASGDKFTFNVGPGQLQDGVYTLGVRTPEPATLAIWSLLGVVGLTVAWRRSQRMRR